MRVVLFLNIWCPDTCGLFSGEQFCEYMGVRYLMRVVCETVELHVLSRLRLIGTSVGLSFAGTLAAAAIVHL